MSGLKLTRGQRLTAMFAAAISVLGTSAVAFASEPKPEALNKAPSVHWFSDWEVNTNPAPPDIYATPFATTGNVPFVQGQMNASAAAGKPLGIKIFAPGLSTAAAKALYNTKYTPGNKAISWVFGDLEGTPTGPQGATAINEIKTMVNQVRSGTWSKNAYVGEFNLVPLKGVGPNIKDGFDPFRRGPLPYTEEQYKQTKVNMANTELYPGEPGFRNRSTFDWANANIRTGLFVAPIGRFTAVQNKLNKDYHGGDGKSGDGDFVKLDKDKHKHVPYVTRFNNAFNRSLDSDNNPNNGYAFHPGTPLPQAGLSAAQTSQQMMGRGDFSAQILHYRMRGAYSVMLFEPGVVGYSKAQMQDDVRRGWYGGGLAPGYAEPAVQHTNNIFAQKDSKNATFTLNPIIDGTTLPNDGKSGFRSENSGTIWSGEYSKNLKQLDILASNLDKVNHLIKFSKNGKDEAGQVDAYDVFTLRGSGVHANDTYDDKSLLAPSRNALIEAGMHRLLQFDLVTTKVYNNSTFTGGFSTKTIWLLNQNYLVFTNNNRNDVGIPEPTTFGMLAAAGSMAVVCRRQRRKDA